jgi:hypothetical protein
MRAHLYLWSVVLAIAIGVSGCGKSTVKTDTSAHVRTVGSAPAYRVGQYCLPGKEAKYRPAGFACRKHHLVRR